MARATNVFTRESASAPASSAAFASGSIRATLGESFTIKGRRATLRTDPDHLGEQIRVARKKDPAVPGVGAGDVELVGGDALGVFEHPDDFDIIFDGVAEHVGEDRSGAAQFRQFIADEGADADILEPDGVEHAGLGFPDARRRVAVHRLAGKTLDHDAAESGQIHQIPQLDAVGVGAGGRQHRGFQRDAAQRSSQAGRHFVTE